MYEYVLKRSQSSHTLNRKTTGYRYFLNFKDFETWDKKLIKKNNNKIAQIFARYKYFNTSVSITIMAFSHSQICWRQNQRASAGTLTSSTVTAIVTQSLGK
jgi:hypothetical protein